METKTRDDWLTAEPPLSDDPPPMPLRMLWGGARVDMVKKVKAAARWALRQATTRGQFQPDLNFVVDATVIALLGWDTHDGLDPNGPNPDPVPPVFWPDPIPARAVVHAAVEWNRARRAFRSEARGDGVSQETMLRVHKATMALGEAVDDLVSERHAEPVDGDRP